MVFFYRVNDFTPVHLVDKSLARFREVRHVHSVILHGLYFAHKFLYVFCKLTGGRYMDTSSIITHRMILDFSEHLFSSGEFHTRDPLKASYYVTAAVTFAESILSSVADGEANYRLHYQVFYCGGFNTFVRYGPGNGPRTRQHLSTEAIGPVVEQPDLALAIPAPFQNNRTSPKPDERFWVTHDYTSGTLSHLLFHTGGDAAIVLV